MKNKSSGWISPVRLPLPGRRAASMRLATLLTLGTLATVFTGCSSKVDNSGQTSSITASNVTLTSEQREHVHLYTVAPSQFRKVIETTGTVDFDNDHTTTVLAPVSGPVSKLLVSLGDQVAADQPLATADSPDFATDISAYRKALATAKTTRELANLDQDLLQHHGVAQKEASQAESDAVNAEADRDAALQQLVALKVDAQTIKDIQDGRPVSQVEGIIRSPVAGTVVQKLITPGELLQAGTTPCFTVADLSHMWVMAHIFGSDLAAVKTGDPVKIVTDVAAPELNGTVDNISALVDPDTRSVAVRVVAENPGGILKKDMYVRVLIQSRQENSGLLIPVSAVLRDDENLAFIYVAQSDGGFARQHVTLGYRTGDQYDVTSGLKAGEQIVVDGGIFMQFQQDQ
jgi:cobalt-zinc-cadmium efflux system membrane fusion protein